MKDYEKFKYLIEAYTKLRFEMWRIKFNLFLGSEIMEALEKVKD